jgi:hypothetical protein
MSLIGPADLQCQSSPQDVPDKGGDDAGPAKLQASDMTGTITTAAKILRRRLAERYDYGPEQRQSPWQSKGDWYPSG